MKGKKEMNFQTLAIHGSKKEKNPWNAYTSPICQTSTFTFKNMKEVEDFMSGKKKTYLYTRIGNPNQEELERLLADLEGGEGAIAFISGMAAISSTIRTLVKSGDHVICGQVLYGCTDETFTQIWPKFDIEFSFVDTKNFQNIKKAVKNNTKLIFLETPANPTMDLADIEAVATLARERGLLLVVDNTFATPYNQRPLSLGADLVIHSLTKYLNGHGDIVGGAVIGKSDLIGRIRQDATRSGECILPPFECFFVIRGIKTLPNRMKFHNYNAFRLAKLLERHPKVSKVLDPGLPSHPQYKLALRQMRTPLGYPGFSGVLSFELKEEKKVEKFVNYLVSHSFVKLAVSLGCIDTLIEVPALMTHAKIFREERLKKGITDGLIRVSVGNEYYKDIEAAFEEALKKAA